LKSNQAATEDRKLRAMLVISNLTFGGAERQVVEIANHLESKGLEVHVCILSEHAPLASRLKLPARLHKIPKAHKYDFSVVFALRRLIRQLNIDVVHGFLFDAEIASRLAGWFTKAMVIGSERNSEYRYGNVHYYAYRLTSKLVSMCIANSNAGRRLNQATFGHADDHYRVIYNGVDLERFRVRDANWAKCNLQPVGEKFVIGMVGSFKPQKNHHYLLEVICELKKKRTDFVVLVAGTTIFEGDDESNRYLSEIKQRINELDLGQHVHLIGAVERVEYFYPLCHLTVLTSKHEGTPNVALESLACGTPVVATNVADNAYVIPHERVGYVVPGDDASLFAETIEQVLINPDLLNRLQIAAREWVVSEFSTSDMAQNFRLAYEQITSRLK
jgi:glycosyltransferase involved in cell wall biosynthesis